MKNFFIELPRPHKVIISTFSIIFMILLLVPSEKASAGRQSEEMSLEIGKRYQIKIPTSATEVAKPNVNSLLTTTSTAKAIVVESTDTIIKPIEEYTWDTAKVKSGDSLAKILRRLGYSSRTTYEIAKAKGENTKLLQTLRIGVYSHTVLFFSSYLFTLSLSSRSVVRRRDRRGRKSRFRTCTRSPNSWIVVNQTFIFFKRFVRNFAKGVPSSLVVVRGERYNFHDAF